MMRKIKTLGLLLICMVLIPTTSHAEADNIGPSSSWYVEGAVGYSKPRVGRGTDRNPGNGTLVQPATQVEFPVNYKNGFLFGGAVGYGSESARLELELKNLNNKIEQPGANNLGTNDIRTLAAFANVWFGFDGYWGIHPYLGGGLGGVQRKINGAKDSVAAAQVGLGFDWRVADHLTLTSGYRYIDTPSMNFSRGMDDLSTTFKTHTLSVGIRYSFFDDKKPAPAVSVSVVPLTAPANTDSDGVLDKVDSCPGTSQSTPVDSKGCPQTSDSVVKTEQ